MKDQNLLLSCRPKLIQMLKPKVLNVDDEPFNGLMFRNIFKNKYEIFIAESGSAGLKILEENIDINVVISDMSMPGMNGIEFTRKAKELNPDLACFILSGYDLTPEISKSIEEGLIKKYFQKPIQVDEINSSIAEELILK